MQSHIATIITDLDNTLYDWVAMWGAAFSAMLRVLVEQSGIDQAVLEAEAREVHRRYGTTEYAFIIQALPSLQRRHPGRSLIEVHAEAIRAYREARERSLRLFPTVKDTLATLRAKGCLLVGYTDSRAFYSAYRVRKLGLDGVLDFLFSPPDHDLPDEAPALRSRPPEAYGLEKTVHRHAPEGEVKPNPRVLAAIMKDVGALPARTVYVGDSLMKDVRMAQEAGVIDVFARYGLAQHRDEYALLRRVSHWTDAEIEREKALKEQRDVSPSFTLKEGFSELLELFEFEPFAERPAA
jgi:phosphoglycolate phosphatase-like HAD superfamily hydrolase